MQISSAKTWFIALLWVVKPAVALDIDARIRQLEVPPGFTVSIFSAAVPNARQITRSDSGTLFVGSRRAGTVYALLDHDDDFVADEVYRIANKLNMPSGVAYRDGALYVAEVDRILRFDDIEQRLADPPPPVVLNDDFPSDTHHGWKFIAFGPDGKLYVPVGAPCNICAPKLPYGSIQRLDIDGTDLTTYVQGVRNSVGFAWHPRTEELWFTDNGRDYLGDDAPPCELNRVTKTGQHFGYPYVHGDAILDPKYGRGHSLDEFEAPARALDAHVAPLGMMFYTASQFPEQYHNAIFIAEHGSWNRSRKSGYRVTMVQLDERSNARSYVEFVSGWKQGESVWGRPVDLEQLPDGSILISDDKAGAIYRVSYSAASH